MLISLKSTRRNNMIAVTGASGKLGQLTIESLLKKVSASEVIALVRNPSKVLWLETCE
jgi:uncharacterized protein YbjT (DUF2867 family)